MLKKIGSFFEEHVEKIVLVVVGLLCVFLFIFRVLFSPNIIEIVNNEGKTEKLSPGVIDERVYLEAVQLNQRQRASSSDSNSYKPQIPDFLAVLDSAVGKIDLGVMPLQPEENTTKVAARGQYNVPQNIGGVTEVAIEHIRAAAYVPTEPVTEQRTYDQVAHEPNDIDLVTVEAKYDIAALYNLLYERFVDQVEELWEDPCLAKPVFAGVNLQRRELRNNGAWSDWQNVPRPATDHYKRLFEQILDKQSLPPGGFKIQRLQFDNKQLQIDLLQPQAYQMASAREEFYPPVLHKDYTAAMKDERQREIQEARDAERQERTSATTTRSRRGNVGDSGRLGGGGGVYDGGTGSEGGRGARRGSRRGTSRGGNTGLVDSGINTGRSSRRGRGRQLETEMYPLQPGTGLTTQISALNEVYREYNKIRLTWTTDLSKMREPLTFWAHDDTVEPEKTYQYRIRLGVFNPVAEGKEDDAIIWSDFSDLTKPVDIPGRLYFFASRPETAKTVTLTVCKYFLGYWRSEDFRGVGPGGAIGGIVEYEPEEPEQDNFIVGGQDMGLITPVVTKPEEQSVEPESINYDTGAVLVDVVTVNEWVPSSDRNLSIKPYSEVLYSFDGTMIEHMPVGLNNWPEKIRSAIFTVQRLSKEEPEPFKQFSASRTQQGTGMRGMGDDMLYEEQMMMDQMGGRY